MGQETATPETPAKMPAGPGCAPDANAPFTIAERGEFARWAGSLGVVRLSRELGISRGAIGSILAGTEKPGTRAMVKPRAGRLRAELAAAETEANRRASMCRLADRMDAPRMAARLVTPLSQEERLACSVILGALARATFIDCIRRINTKTGWKAERIEAGIRATRDKRTRRPVF